LGKVWSVDLGTASKRTEGKLMLHYHGGSVRACAVSPVAHLLATVGDDGMLR
jgi:hypothetical protein